MRDVAISLLGAVLALAIVLFGVPLVVFGSLRTKGRTK